MSRLIILVKAAAEIRRALDPRTVGAVHLEGKQVDEQLRGANAYLVVYMLLLLLSMLVVALDGKGI